MITNKTTGTYNLVNPGIIEHNDILKMYQSLCDPTHKWTLVDYDSQMKFIKSHRSNNEMTTDKLQRFCEQYNIPLPNINESVERCIKLRKSN